MDVVVLEQKLVSWFGQRSVRIYKQEKLVPISGLFGIYEFRDRINHSSAE